MRWSQANCTDAAKPLKGAARQSVDRRHTIGMPPMTSLVLLHIHISHARIGLTGPPSCCPRAPWLSYDSPSSNQQPPKPPMRPPNVHRNCHPICSHDAGHGSRIPLGPGLPPLESMPVVRFICPLPISTHLRRTAISIISNPDKARQISSQPFVQYPQPNQPGGVVASATRGKM